MRRSPEAKSAALARLTLFLVWVVAGWGASAGWAGERAPAAGRGPPRSMAVLGFTVQSPWGATEWLGAGFAESLSAKLGRTDELVLVERRRVREVLRAAAPPATDADGAKLGRVLGVRYLLLGSVQTEGPSLAPDAGLAVRARVVSVETGEVAAGLAFSLSGRMTDLFALQTRLAEDVCKALGVPFDPADIGYDDCSELEAYRLYHLGNEARDAGRFREAIELYDRAMAANGGRFFGAAHHAQGEAYASLADEARGPEKEQIGREHLERFERDAQEAAPALLDLALAYEANGKEAEALQAARDYLAWSPKPGPRALWSAGWRPRAWDGAVGFVSQVVEPSRAYVLVAAQDIEEAGALRIVAAEPRSGDVLWESPSFGTSTGIVSAGDVLYVVATGAREEARGPFPVHLYTVSKEDGRFLAKARIGEHARHAGLAAAAGRVYWVTDTAVTAADPSSGEVLWRTRLGGRPPTRDEAEAAAKRRGLMGREDEATLLGVWEDLVLVYRPGGLIERIRTADGVSLGRVELEGPLGSPAGWAVSGDRVYLHAGRSLVVLDPRAGTEVARRDVGFGPRWWRDEGTLWVDGGSLFVGTEKGLSSLDPRTLEPLWHVGSGTQARILRSAGPRLYAGFGDADLKCVEKKTGKVVWSVEWKRYAHGNVVKRVEGSTLLTFDFGLDAVHKSVSAFDLAGGEPDDGLRAVAAHVLVGELSRRRGDPAGAKKAFEAALSLRRASAEAHLGLGELAFASDKNLALAHLAEAALTAAPGSATLERVTARLLEGYGLAKVESLGYARDARILAAGAGRLVLETGDVQNNRARKVVGKAVAEEAKGLGEGASPVVLWGSVGVWNDPEGIVCRDLDTGALRWRRQGALRSPRTSGRVLAYLDGRDVVAADLEDGRTLYRAAGTDVEVDGDVLLVRACGPPEAQGRCTLRALRLPDATPLWEREEPAPAARALQGATLYLALGEPKGRLQALDAESGRERWSLDFERPIRALFARPEGVVAESGRDLFFVDAAGRRRVPLLYAFHPMSVRRETLEEPLVRSFDSGFYDIWGMLFAFDLASGRIGWTFQPDVWREEGPVFSAGVVAGELHALFGKKRCLRLTFDLERIARMIGAGEIPWLRSAPTYVTEGLRKVEWGDYRANMARLLAHRPRAELEQLLDGGDTSAGLFALEALALIVHDPDELALLRGRMLLASIRPADHVEAVAAYAGTARPEAGEALVRLLFHPEAPVRRASLEAASGRGTLADFRRALEQNRFAFTGEAVSFLAGQPDAPVDLLLLASDAAAPEVGEPALGRLGKVDRGELFAPLVAHLAGSAGARRTLRFALDAYPRERLAADERFLQALSRELVLGQDKALQPDLVEVAVAAGRPPLLFALFLGRADPDLRRRISQALAQTSLDPGSVGPLSACVEAERDPQVRGNLVDALGRIGGEEARRVLANLARGGQPEVAEKARRALGRAP